ncbi:unnamed protein product [Cyprideis torosa]|uniref:Uncharacterized protein n=1 Tax=Cyprideis torosa TaxID=163714 RepID=A0A7R8W3M8_9CRUS|nr:unnamed protein product [Cyprideis torosa]CAG0879828.1 unnamed protein product [Cyprideis torosa]
MSFASTDTTNKVVFCSAVIGGFAYVGYSFVRHAFDRHPSKRSDDAMRPRSNSSLPAVYLRRLSQTTQTDILMANLESGDKSRIYFRPLSVHERIKELNSKSREFGDTLLAIQGFGGLANAITDKVGATVVPKSLQCSPWTTPRTLSPVHVREHDFGSAMSTDSESSRRTWSSFRSPCRRTVQSTGSSGSPSATSSRKISPVPLPKDELAKDYEVMLEKEKESAVETLSTLSASSAPAQRTLSQSEAKALTALLYIRDESQLQRALNVLREVGCLLRLLYLLTHQNIGVAVAAVTALSNMALNEENIKQCKMGVVLIAGMICGGFDKRGDISPRLQPLLLPCLMALTNMTERVKELQKVQRLGCRLITAAFHTTPTMAMEMALGLEPIDIFVAMAAVNAAMRLKQEETWRRRAVSLWHSEVGPVIPCLHSLLDIHSTTTSLLMTGAPVLLQSLRLLVNLSCNDQMIPCLLAAQGSKRLVYLLNPGTISPTLLLRLVTYLSNLSTATRRLGIDPAHDLPPDEKAPSPDTMYACLFGVNIRDKIRAQAQELVTTEFSEFEDEIRRHAGRLTDALSSPQTTPRQEPSTGLLWQTREEEESDEDEELETPRAPQEDDDDA